MKAYLIHIDVQFPKTHQLSQLLDLISQEEEIDSDLYEKAEYLAAYAIEVRYPFARYQPTEVDTKKSIAYADFFRDWVSGKLDLE